MAAVVVAFAPATGDHAARRSARGAHRWHFEGGADAQLNQLRKAQPRLDWRLASGVWSVPYGDFMSIVLEFAGVGAGGLYAGSWKRDLPGTAQVDRCFQEVCKGMMAADWDPCELGELGERLRVAAMHPVVDRAAILLFTDAADGGRYQAAEQAAHVEMGIAARS